MSEPSQTTQAEPLALMREPETPQQQQRVWEEEDKEGRVRAAFVASARVLQQEPSLVLWSVLGQILGALLGLAPLFVVMMALAVQLLAVTQGAPVDQVSDALLLSWGFELLLWALKPDVVVGVMGMVAVTWAVTWTLGVAVDSGTLGAQRQRLRAGAEMIAEGLFWGALGERFEALLVWRVLRGLVLLASAVLTMGLVWSVGLLLAGWGIHLGGGLGDLGVLSLAVGSVAALGVMTALVWIVLFDVALGRMILLGEGLGDALWSSAEALGHHTNELAPLFGNILAAYGVVYGVYLPFYMLAVVLGSEPDMATSATVVQMALDALMAVAWIVVGLGCRGAVLAWVGIQTGEMAAMPVLPDDLEPSSSSRSRGGGGPSTASQPVAVRLAQADVGDLSPLLPTETPYRTTISRVTEAVARMEAAEGAQGPQETESDPESDPGVDGGQGE
ncbi:MAG: hypothetical protein AAFX99_21955 [Myxococcota bacterium]